MHLRYSYLHISVVGNCVARGSVELLGEGEGEGEWVEDSKGMGEVMGDNNWVGGSEMEEKMGGAECGRGMSGGAKWDGVDDSDCELGHLERVILGALGGEPNIEGEVWETGKWEAGGPSSEGLEENLGGSHVENGRERLVSVGVEGAILLREKNGKQSS